MSDVVIRAETEADHAAIRVVVADAFGGVGVANMVESIRASPNYRADRALVAERDGEIVGFVMISDVGLRAANGDVGRIASLSPLAVAPAVQRTGIGSALVRAVTALADEQGEPVVVLEGSPNYYPKFGFTPSASHGITITLPDWAPPDAAQIIMLRDYDPSIRGHVVYPPAFAEAD